MPSRPSASPTIAEATFAPFRALWRVVMVLLLLWFFSAAANVAWVRWHGLDAVAHMHALIDYHVERGGEVSERLAMCAARFSVERLRDSPGQPAERSWQDGEPGRRQTGGLGTSLHRGLAVTFRLEIAVVAYSVVLFCAKLGILLGMALVFALLLAVAAVDGLVQRAIRKACGGVESAALYHRAKLHAFRLLPPAAGLLFFCAPVSLEPAWIFVPFMLLSALLVRVQATYYKKHL